jgi:hypothetical protein
MSGNQRGDQRLACRALERGRNTSHEHEGVDAEDRNRPRCQGHQHQGGSGQWDELGRQQHQAAIVSIDDHTTDEAQRERRDKAHEPDDSEVESRAGQRIHLPGDDGLEHRLGDPGRETPARIESERSDAQDGAEIALCDRRWSYSPPCCHTSSCHSQRWQVSTSR